MAVDGVKNLSNLGGGGAASGTAGGDLSGTYPNPSVITVSTATAANTASRIVQRDSSGNFTASTISGTVTLASALNVSTNGVLLGRATAGSGASEQLAASGGITITSGTVSSALRFLGVDQLTSSGTYAKDTSAVLMMIECIAGGSGGGGAGMTAAGTAAGGAGGGAGGAAVRVWINGTNMQSNSPYTIGSGGGGGSGVSGNAGQSGTNGGSTSFTANTNLIFVASGDARTAAQGGINGAAFRNGTGGASGTNAMSTLGPNGLQVGGLSAGTASGGDAMIACYQGGSGGGGSGFSTGASQSVPGQGARGAVLEFRDLVSAPTGGGGAGGDPTGTASRNGGTGSTVSPPFLGAGGGGGGSNVTANGIGGTGGPGGIPGGGGGGAGQGTTGGGATGASGGSGARGEIRIYKYG